MVEATPANQPAESTAEITEAKPNPRAISPPRATVTNPRTWFRPVALLAILLVAALFRFQDLNWDQGQHFHPDERYMTNVATQLGLPSGLTEFFDSGESPLNPFNTREGRGYVYGTAPMFATRFAAEFLDTGCAPNKAALASLLGRVLFSKDATDCSVGFFIGYDSITLTGRLLSGLYDLISVFTLFFIGRKLFGWRIGLLAAAFNAAAVVPIQQSHYFTVDSMATMFVTLALYFCARIAMMQVKNARGAVMLWVNAALGGLMSGFAVASKISAWPIAAIVIACVVIALVRDRRQNFNTSFDALIAVIFVGVFAFAGLRIGQPYGFTGTSESEFLLTVAKCEGYEGLLKRACDIGTKLPEPVRAIGMPSGRWLDVLSNASFMASGKVDVPFGHQWADRPAIVFPLINLIFWGLGLPLGLAACVGFFYLLQRLLRGRRWWAALPIVLWTGSYFLYQSTQWVKSIRYLFPIYPTLCLCAAVLLVGVWQRTRRQTANDRRPFSVVRRLSSVVVTPLILFGTLLWAIAFSGIYREPITRVVASTWIYQNVPTAATLSWDGGSAQLPITELALTPGTPANIQLDSRFLLPIQPDGKLGTEWPSLKNLKLILNKVEGSGNVQLTLMDAEANAPIADVQHSITASSTTFSLASANLQQGKPYYFILQLTQGESISARTSRIGTETWDDALPWGGIAERGFGSFYQGLWKQVKNKDGSITTNYEGQIENYAEDDPSKLPLVLNWLDSADYISMSSNRLYGSIPRLPWRFPMTTEYYRALLGGELGFELAADFNSFPRLGPITFNSQELPQKLARPDGALGGDRPGQFFVPYPTAEEAFSVYDHPRVLIFKKTAKYSHENAERLLGKFDLTRVIKNSPLQNADAPYGLIMDSQTREAQAAGGTWSELYPRSSPLNQSQPLAVLAWLALMEVLGLAAFPIIALATRTAKGPGTWATLADGGYSFAKALGLLIVAVAVWWVGSLQWLKVTPTLLWGAVVLLMAVGAHLWFHQRNAMLSLIKTHWKIMLASELVFLGALGLWLWVRAGNPDLWHLSMGGEKPMDFAYLNAVLKSEYFPPFDPWFAGGFLNYYYFGWVIIGWPIKALGIDPAVAYNIALPTLFALTAMGAFGLGATMFAAIRKHEQAMRGAIVAGIAAAIFVVGIGNGDQIRVVGPAWQKLGGIEQGEPAVSALVKGFVKWAGGEALPIYPNWPYWNPTRPTEDIPGNPVMIAEFPQFTFLYADLHAHMMAMPIALMALAFALAFAGGGRSWAAVGLGALAAGALWSTNTWDYYPHLLLGVAGLLLPQPKLDGSPLRLYDWVSGAIKMLPMAIAFFVLTRAFFIPYLITFGNAYNSVDPWTAEKTPIKTYITIYGTFMLPLLAYALLQLRRGINWAKPLTSQLPVLVLGAGALATAFLLIKAAPISILAMPMIALCVACALLPTANNQSRLMWLASAGAFALTIFVDLYALKGDRMNTVFKFYITAWLLLGVTSATAFMAVVAEVFAKKPAPQPQSVQPTEDDGERTVVLRPAPAGNFGLGKAAFAAGMALALFLAALYPAFAIPAKMRDRYVPTLPKGLDGMAYMQAARYADAFEGREKTWELKWDYEAIRWMQDNVKGSPTIIEEGSARGAQYRWSGRFAIYTGLPAVLGWQYHQRQQRAALDDRVVYDRDQDVADFYRTPDPEQALLLLRRYNVKYIILGDMENIYHSPAGLPKFEQLLGNGALRVAYQNEGTTIYEVNGN